MPITPAVKPIMIVSALNTLETSIFLAPILLKIPISFVRSITDTYVIIPIIIELTTSETPAKAINTYEIMLIIEFSEERSAFELSVYKI